MWQNGIEFWSLDRHLDFYAYHISAENAQKCALLAPQGFFSCDREISDEARFLIPTLPNTVTLLHQCNSSLHCLNNFDCFDYFDHSTCQQVPGSVGEGTRCRPWRRPRQSQSTCKHKSITNSNMYLNCSWGLELKHDHTHRHFFSMHNKKKQVSESFSPCPTVLWFL